MIDYLIVGSGLFGSTIAYLLNKHGYKCMVIEKRKQYGGNLYCEDYDGINVHAYGPHIFHTSDKKIWDFVNQFVEFNNYVNEPLAYCGIDKTLYHLPFNMDTFNRMWNDVITPQQAKEKINSLVKTSNPTNFEEQAISLVGEDIYKKLIKEYTEKQWGRDCKDLPKEIINRLPLRFSYNNNYFNDRYQGIPIGGYNILIDKLLEGIEKYADTNFINNKEYFRKISRNIIYTGSIDEFFDYMYGTLEWRSLEWEYARIDTPSYQGNAVINYTTKEVPWTRIIEHKYFENLTEDTINKIPYTIISKEYPVEWNLSKERFYPINNEKNSILYNRYLEYSKNFHEIHFCGRLGEYKYYDMDDTIIKAFELFNKIKK